MKSNWKPETSLAEGFELQSGKYIIKRVLGQGGFDITYFDKHTMLDVQVTVKELFPISSRLIKSIRLNILTFRRS